MASGVINAPLACDYQALVFESGFTGAIGVGVIYVPLKNRATSSKLSYMRAFGKFQKTGTQTVTSGTIIGHLTTSLPDPGDYVFPLVAYDTATGYIHSGLVFNPTYRQLLVRTNDASFLTAINNGHVFHFSTTF